MAHENSELTVRTLLAEPVLHGHLLGGAEGLQHRVGWCLPFSEVAASPSDGRDLSGIAVLLPAAELAGDGSDALLLADLARRGSSVVLVRQGHETAVDLEETAGAADRLGLPLVELPTSVDYHRVGRLVAAKTLAGNAHVLEYTVRVHRALGEVFATGSGLPALAGTMSTLSGDAVLITDEQGEVLATADGLRARTEAEWRKFAHTLHEGPNCARQPAQQAEAGFRSGTLQPERATEPHVHQAAEEREVDAPWGGSVYVVSTPVRVAGQTFGTVAVIESAFPPEPHDLAQHRVIVEQGAPLVASELLRQRSVTEAEERARDDFLDTLIHGRFEDVHELEARSRHHRFDVHARHAVYAVSAPGLEATSGQRLIRTLASTGESGRPFAMAGYVGQLLVVVSQLPEAEAAGGHAAAAEQASVRRFGERLRRTVRERTEGMAGEVVVAYGRGARGAAGVASGYREARIALDLSRRVEVRDVCGYEELRVFAAIEQSAAAPQGRAFAREVLEPLWREDGQTGNLEHVVLAYIAESGNLNAAARRLQLHRNTMLYKLERVSRALQMDIRSSETQFTIWLAHRFHTLNESLRTLDAELTPPA